MKNGYKTDRKEVGKMFFERELYPELVRWARESNQALFLNGPRQVGKTEMLLKLGAECFERCVYITGTASYSLI
jgi:predicted AAA+ superfamily ATPase